MAEFIDREVAKAKIREKFKFVPARIEINEVLNSIPAADVRPVVRGKWISGDARNVTAVCSNCGHLRLGNGAESATRYAPFCEKCGAYMREES